MNARTVMLVSSLAALHPAVVHAGEQTYPPSSEYMMPREAEIALARSAAPASVSARATVKVLSATGYEVAATGDNGFVCLVMRGWSAPMFTAEEARALVYDSKLRAPICFDPVASRTVLPLQELRAKLGLQGKGPDAITSDVTMAYARGTLPKMDGVAFGYMLSADQSLGGDAGAWRPHIMVYAPYYTNELLGNNEFAGPLPFVGSDEGTPFAIVVIAVDGTVAVSSKGTSRHHSP